MKGLRALVLLLFLLMPLISYDSVRTILRRTGNIFLCGNGEGGGAGVYELFGSVPLALALMEDSAHGVLATDGGGAAGTEEVAAEHSDGEEGDGGGWDSIGEGTAHSAHEKLRSQAALSKEQSEICNLVHGMLLRVAR